MSVLFERKPETVTWARSNKFSLLTFRSPIWPIINLFALIETRKWRDITIRLSLNTAAVAPSGEWYWSIFPNPPLFDAPARGNRLEFLDETYPAKTRGMGLPYGENFMILSSAVFENWQLKGQKSPNFAYREVETRARGHSRSLILVPMESACAHSY